MTPAVDWANLRPASGLFERSGSVVVEEAVLPPEPLSIDPGEAEQVAGAVLRRRIEYSAGRACARRALTRLGFRPFVLRNGADRAPLWPQGVVGSITHTGDTPGGYCGVAVARSSAVRAVGLDAEGGGPLETSIWPSVLTPAERDHAVGREQQDPGRWAKLVFSAKECFYKAQYPLSRRYLDFRDVEVTVTPETTEFTVRIVGNLEGDMPLRACRGKYAMLEDLIVTGIVVPI